MKHTLLLILVSTLSLGCAAAKLGPLDPKPKIKVDEQDATLALSIDAEVPDRFTIPAAGGVRKVRVKGWHETLTRGFENGFAKAYELQSPAAEYDLLLVFVRADLQFVPTPGIATEGSTPAKAKLIYRVRVLDKGGSVLAVAGGELVSRGTWSATGEQDAVTAEVVAAMYKDIAFELVTKTSPEPEDEEPEPGEAAPPPADSAPTALD